MRRTGQVKLQTMAENLNLILYFTYANLPKYEQIILFYIQPSKFYEEYRRTCTRLS